MPPWSSIPRPADHPDLPQPNLRLTRSSPMPGQSPAQPREPRDRVQRPDHSAIYTREYSKKLSGLREPQDDVGQFRRMEICILGQNMFAWPTTPITNKILEQTRPKRSSRIIAFRAIDTKQCRYVHFQIILYFWDYK